MMGFNDELALRSKKEKKYRELIIKFLKNKEGGKADFGEIINFLGNELGEEFKEGYGIPKDKDNRRVVKSKGVLLNPKYFSRSKKGVRTLYSIV